MNHIFRNMLRQISIDAKEVGIGLRLSFISSNLFLCTTERGAEREVTSSSCFNKAWNHSKAPVSRLIQMNSTLRSAPSLFIFCIYLYPIHQYSFCRLYYCPQSASPYIFQNRRERSYSNTSPNQNCNFIAPLSTLVNEEIIEKARRIPSFLKTSSAGAP